MANRKFRVGDLVWFRPKEIGYGYSYGTDRGIPAVVYKVTAKRVCLEFSPKDSPDVIRIGHTVPANVELRQP